MTEKLQQLTDELEKELSALDNATIERIITYQQCSAVRLRDLQEYLIEQGMNSVWRVENVTGAWRINLNMFQENGEAAASIRLCQKGVETAELYNISAHDVPEQLAADRYERIIRNFIEAIQFFQNLDYEALNKYVRGLEFCDENELKELRSYTGTLKAALCFFKNHMEKNKK